MGNKWLYLRLAITAFMTILSCGIIYITTHTAQISSHGISWVYALIGILFIVMGNYLPATKPNYFVGIRTPWTLESDLVWRKTHRLGGKLFIINGVLLFASLFLFSTAFSFWFLLGTTIALTIIIFTYSYRTFKSLYHE